MAATWQFVGWSSGDRVATVTINRPPLNPLSHQLKTELAECLELVAADQSVGCLVLHGAGGRAFSVGSDIKEFPEIAARKLGRQHAVQEHALYNRIHFFPIPTIAAIEGHCLGGGLELALACDLRTASEASQLGFPEVKLGLYPAGGGTERLPRLVGESRARLLIYTGEAVDAREAHRIGLVDRLAPAGGALPAAQALARVIAAHPRVTLRAVKSVLDHGLSMDPVAAQQLSVQAIEMLFSEPEAQACVQAFLAQRAARRAAAQ